MPGQPAMDALVAACPSPTLLEFRATILQRVLRYRGLALKLRPEALDLPALPAALRDAALARDAARAGDLAEARIQAEGKAILGAAAPMLA